MLELARVGPDCKVLDVAAGAGGQTLAAARRAGDRGSVLAPHISPKILALAQRAAAAAGLANVTTQAMDGERLRGRSRVRRRGHLAPRADLLPGSGCRTRGHAPSVAPRWAVRGRRLLDVRGEPVLLGPPFRSSADARPNRPAPGHPGPFSHGAPEAIAAALTHAGFTEIEVRQPA